MNKNFTIIGVGNTFRNDDAVGRLAVHSISDCISNTVRVVEASGEGSQIIEVMTGAETVIIIDAVCSGGTPGTVYKLNAREDKVPSQFFHYSSHQFGVAEAIEVARTLGSLPEKLILIGIEGKNFEFGTTLSPEVEKALPDVHMMIHEIVGTIPHIKDSCNKNK